MALAVIVAAGAGGIWGAQRTARPTVEAAGQRPSAAPSATSPPVALGQSPAPTKSPPGSVTQPPRSPDFPPAASWGFARPYWAVLLAVTRPGDDRKPAQARRQARAAGYQEADLVEVPIGCQAGAREGLARAGVRLDPDIDYATVALFFDNRKQAAAFVDAYQPGVVGTVLVTLACAD